MTDEKSFIEMCERFGIVLSQDDEGPPRDFKEASTAHVISDGDGPKQGGYTGFFSTWYFDADGKFVGVGSWE